MNPRLIFFALIVLSFKVSARDENWINSFLDSKFIKCDLSEAQLNNQLEKHLDVAVKKLRENLENKGLAVQKISQEREHFEIGIFPKSEIFDFYVRESVKITVRKSTYELQTVRFDAIEKPPVGEHGLWLPLVVNDPGFNIECQLERVSIGVAEKDRKYIPIVNVITQNAQKLIAVNVLDVIDVSLAAGVEKITPVAKGSPAIKEKPFLDSR